MAITVASDVHAAKSLISLGNAMGFAKSTLKHLADCSETSNLTHAIGMALQGVFCLERVPAAAIRQANGA